MSDPTYWEGTTVTRSKKLSVPRWAKLATRKIAKDGMKRGWPTEKGIKEVVEGTWGNLIMAAYSTMQKESYVKMREYFDNMERESAK